MNKHLRDQVRAEILTVMAAAQEEGRDPCRAARQAFPGVPDGVVWELSADLLGLEEEAWWQQVERTIDGEVIRNAVAKAGQA
ncbi:hypothetical protein [Methylorubrum thiocyanatum]|uniref:hypothetical protein n=1 Tax=Methylorubrum thiocyanatum TaxID=47958 RepID=UPI00364F7CB8